MLFEECSLLAARRDSIVLWGFQGGALPRPPLPATGPLGWPAGVAVRCGQSCHEFVTIVAVSPFWLKPQ